MTTTVDKMQPTPVRLVWAGADRKRLIDWWLGRPEAGAGRLACDLLLHPSPVGRAPIPKVSRVPAGLRMKLPQRE